MSQTVFSFCTENLKFMYHLLRILLAFLTKNACLAVVIFHILSLNKTKRDQKVPQQSTDAAEHMIGAAFVQIKTQMIPYITKDEAGTTKQYEKYMMYCSEINILDEGWCWAE